jgi:hypothetical protein
MCWLTWQADHGHMTQKMIDDYNAEMHVTLPKLIGGKISISALDEKLGKLIEEFVELAHEVDEKIGQACLAFQRNPAEGIDLLKRLNENARDFDGIIFHKFGDLGRGRPHVSLLERMLKGWSERFSTKRPAVI